MVVLALANRFVLCRLVLLASILSLVFAGPVLAEGSPLTQSDELATDVATVVVVDPSRFAVTTTHDYMFTNESRERDVAGFTETIPGDAAVVTAQAGQVSLETGLGLRGGDVMQLFVSFAEPLGPGESATVRLVLLQEAVVGLPEDLNHVSPSLVAIDPFAVGNGTGPVTLHVEIPRGFGLDVIEGWDIVPGEGSTTFVRSEAVPYEPAPLVASNPDALQRQSVAGLDYAVRVATLLGPEVDLTGLVADVASGLAEWLPAIPTRPVEIRTGWTGDDDVRWVGNDEATVAVVGINPSEASIARAMAQVLSAELAWADESLAGEVADAVTFAWLETREFGGGAAIDRSEGWTDPLSSAFRQAGQEATAAVISAVIAGTNTYEGPGPADADIAADWRALLDAIENMTDINVSSRFRAVASPQNTIAIDARDSARGEYSALEILGDGWAMPLMLRVPMAEWDFVTFDGRRLSVAELIEAHDVFVLLADEEDLVIGPYVRKLFEASDSTLDAAWIQLAAEESAIGPVGEALRLVTTERGAFARVGMANINVNDELDLIIEEWEAGDAEDAAHRAEELIETYEGAVGRGTIRLIIPLALLSVLAWFVRLVHRRLHPSSAE